MYAFEMVGAILIVLFFAALMDTQAAHPQPLIGCFAKVLGAVVTGT